ncbi:aspartic peptidase domain-containing protein [Schizothecium vesticola]|uniref:Aspartic peptidase domain-containing protein n=1 Tax=Schizothecium vesticola TaxID=314040 RepID=A0AA40F8F3_9PEZI|nr:aspartic peptidase domain-containing protein [Schizothecium vesticola]
MAPSRSLRSLVCLLASCCARLATAIVEIQVKQHDEGCIHLPIIHSTNVRHFTEKRGVQLKLANRSDVAYYAQLSIGTPPQPVFVQLDTGSFELWVNPDCTTVTGSDRAFCERAGRFDSQLSSTLDSLGTTKELRYGIGSANISYVTDTISLAGSRTALQSVQFGIASASADTFSGILGIGYGSGYTTRYPNFIDQLYAQNGTRVKAYTLALGSKDAQEGIIVFGGVDTSKFAGGLVRLPVIPAAKSPDSVPRFWVDMLSIGISPPGGGASRVYEGSNIPVFLDSGSTMTLLPAGLANAIAADFGVAAPDAKGFYRIDCGFTRSGGTVDFKFQGVTVKVPYKEMIREVPGNPMACFLGIQPSEKFVLLGDTFLRSAYTVFDLENHNVWISQAANCGSTPAALNSAQDLPSVVGLCGNQVVGAVAGAGGSGSAAGSGSSTGGSADGSGGAGRAPGTGVTGGVGRSSPGIIRTLGVAVVGVAVGSCGSLIW